MKLIDLLVKELLKRGGWPEGATHAWSDYDGEIRFRNGGCKPDFYPAERVDSEDRIPSILHEDDPRYIVTRLQYEAALADKNDGWIEWGGGECPVDEDTPVEVRLRGEDYGISVAIADSFMWRHGLDCADIIAYRLHKPHINSRANDDRLEQDLNECIGQDVDMPEWSGDGLPPVGVECEYKFPHVNYRMDFSCGKVLAYGNKKVFMEHWSSKNEFIQPLDNIEFRPLRTEAEKAREKLAASLHIAAGASQIELNGMGPLYFKLADAIISGIVFGTTFKADK